MTRTKGGMGTGKTMMKKKKKMTLGAESGDRETQWRWDLHREDFTHQTIEVVARF